MPLVGSRGFADSHEKITSGPFLLIKDDDLPSLLSQGIVLNFCFIGILSPSLLSCEQAKARKSPDHAPPR